MVDSNAATPQQLTGRLKLRHLRFVRVLAEAGSLQRAAERLAVSYAAVVKTRQEIEAALGAPLLTGRGDAATFTPVARAIDASAQRVLHELDCLGEEILELRSGLRGHVTLGVRLSHALHWLAPAIVEFRAMHPGVSMALVDGLHAAVAAGEVDIGVGRIGSPRWQGALAFTSIAPIRSVVVGSGEAMPLAGTELSWERMLAQEWCLPPAATPLRDRFEDLLRERELSPPARVIEFDGFQTHAQLMRSGSFLGLCSEPAGRALESEGVARILHGPVPELDDQVALFWRARHSLRPVVRSLRDFLQKRAAQCVPV